MSTITENPCKVYGSMPTEYMTFRPDWTEFMHYCYLPVKMEGSKVDIRIPERLGFLAELVEDLVYTERHRGFVYVTARRGFATPGNPLNRPGWHTDGFGTDDINYIWTDKFPTRFLLGSYGGISDDHIESAAQFEQIASVMPNRIFTYGTHQVLRLDASMIHDTPIIPEPGGMRSFFKISLSHQRYNLIGNSHNYLFDYDWEMHDRAVLRNDPAYAGKDSGPQA